VVKTHTFGKLTKEIADTAGVTPFIIIPRHQLDEVIVQGDTCLSIKDGRVGVSNHVGGNDFIFSVC
jgi:hypothetical protein